ncbi:unnamed protein product, partial [Medioppia subpectinata]
YFGPINRSEATTILMSENETGVFLVRNSTTIVGDLVLCVRSSQTLHSFVDDMHSFICLLPNREDNKVSHYIINKIQPSADQTRFRIGDQMFPDVPALLNFYKLHYLDTTPLIRPASKRVEKVRARYDFEGSGDSDDLPFRKNEVLTVISKDEDQWWTARNSLGQTGSIPVPYVELMDESNHSMDGPMNVRSPSLETNANNSCNTSQTNAISRTSEPTKYITPPNIHIQRKLPARAVVNKQRIPNAYDKTALKLEKGDIIIVTKTNINGQWEGELNGKVGHFPFTHVDFMDTDTIDDDNH